MASIGIAGAGLLGRLLAWQLARAGHCVEVFDPAAGPAPSYDGQGAAAFSAAGMLSPLAELDHAEAGIAALGWRSIALWRDIVEQLGAPESFSQRGSLLLAHRSDRGAAERVLARLGRAPAGWPQAQPLDAAALRALEPALQGVAHAWLLPDEAQVQPPAVLAQLQAQAGEGVRWHWGRPVAQVLPGQVLAADGAALRFDWAIDVRGLGARSAALPLRGVRGETVWLHAPAHGLQRPLRLLHPRHTVYLVPRGPDRLFAGASEIESEDRSPVSLRSAVELMAAAHSVLPDLAEARIERLDRNLRPALPDNAPRTEVQPGLLRINGLFRHGWLMAPALVADALAACALASRKTSKELLHA
ncbi:FAD-dependent oxidoreductase [Xylophilus sp. ASV27]|uniref:FAD-dependent oxidoreductase n=1 Tax=Xylophilus sp. ASV27 TaxID=2795129 RepID=UPI0018EE171E|nr:FAD-dependent oxidoreductase [Xylophilus sp. ASV27]